MTRLYLMRHGQTLFNTLNRIQGWCDSPLTQEGIQQAIAVSKTLQSPPKENQTCAFSHTSLTLLKINSIDILMYNWNFHNFHQSVLLEFGLTHIS